MVLGKNYRPLIYRAEMILKNGTNSVVTGRVLFKQINFVESGVKAPKQFVSVVVVLEISNVVQVLIRFTLKDVASIYQKQL